VSVPANLLVIRHATSEWNAAGRWQGWADPPLADTGIRHANDSVAHFANLNFELVVTSDLQRAVHTGQILAAGLGLDPPLTVAGLRERHLGDWSGCTTDEIQGSWPGVFELFRHGKADPPGGESHAEFTHRLQTAVNDLASAVGDRRALVVSHGGAIRMLFALSQAPTSQQSSPEKKLHSGPVKNLCGLWCSVDKECTVHIHDTFDLTSSDSSTSTTIL